MEVDSNPEQLTRPKWRLQASSKPSGSGGSQSSDKGAPPTKRGRVGGKDKDKDTIVLKEKDDKDEGEKQQGARRGGRRGKGRGKGKTEKRLATKDPNLRDLLNMMIKLTLNNSQRVRQLTAAVCDTFLIPHDLGIIKNYDQALEGFQQQVKEYRDKVQAGDSVPPVGPPAPHLVLAILEGMCDLEIGGLNKTKLREQLTTWSALSQMPEEVAEVSLCKIDTIGDDTKRRLQMCIHSLPIRKYMISALVQVGAEHRVGSAPASYLERELSQWAEALAAVQADI